MTFGSKAYMCALQGFTNGAKTNHVECIQHVPQRLQIISTEKSQIRVIDRKLTETRIGSKRARRRRCAR